jgi:FdhE protein
MNQWDRRIDRAFVLEHEVPAAAELLRFYREIAAFQKKVVAAGGPTPGTTGQFLGLLERRAPGVLARAARQLMDARDWDPADPAPKFVARVLAQCAPSCRGGHARPLCSVLRPEGEGGKRSLVCAVCFAEWPVNRIVCPACGEENKDHLPVYTAEQFAYVRVEACDSCRCYLKSIDLTKNGLAVPEVDEIAAVALDVWAAGQGYTKMQVNLFGL